MTLAGSDRNNSEEEVFVFPASFGQQRLWFLDRLFPESSCYNVVNVLRLTGLLNATALEASFNEIVRRHEVLRTNFDTIEGKPVQLVSPYLKISVPLIDLQPVPTTEREAAAQQEIKLLSQQPFNLERGALLRVLLLQLGKAEYVLAIALHHIVFDEWSSALLIRELGLLYTAFWAGKPSLLKEITIQYADFAHWQREYLQGKVLDQQLAYWKSQLQNLPRLEIAPNRPLQPTYQGATEVLELSQDLAQKIALVSQQEGVTLYMTLLAAFQALLCRYTGQTDIAIGSPIANRNRRELEEAIGFFANSLVIRTDLSENPSFKELLARVRHVAVEAYAHQDLPFEKLVELLHPERSLNQNPLFQVVFALQNAPMEQLELPGLTLAPFEVETKTARFDLELYLWECGEDFRSLWGDKWQQSAGLRGILVYNTALFGPDAIALMLQHFQTLLAGAVDNINTKLTDLPLLSAAEEDQILVEWNQTKRAYQKHLCIQQLFENKAANYPLAIALCYKNQQFTYQQLNNGSNQLAHYLQKLGVGKDALVGICLESSPVMVAAMLGILKAGGGYVPLDPAYPVERLQFMVEDTGVTVIVTQSSFAHLFPDNKIVCIERDWQQVALQSDKNLQCQSTAETLAYIVYTSGSTGIPKGVAVTHQAVNRLVCNSNYITWKRGDKVAQCANISFDAATFEIWGALLNGAQLVGIEREILLSPQDFAQALQQQKIDILFLTTALFNQIAREVPFAFRCLKYLLFGGETVDVKSVQAVFESKPQHLLHVYGPTENTTFTTWYEVQHLPEAKTIPIGKAIANTQIYLLDNYLNPVPIGVTAEIYIGGDGLARGYFNRLELTAKQFIPHPWEKSNRLYKTGDFARYLPDGNLEFIGRKDDLVKLRGFRIELGEVETVINQHPKVRESVVIVREESLVAYIVSQNNLQLKNREVSDFLQAKLPNYSIPAVFVFLDKLPLTLNCKVDRRALPAPDFTQNISDQTPRNSVEAQLVELWTGLLGVKAGIGDNFFELGGHSLLATALVSRMRESFGVQLPLGRVFETPTIAGLAEYIASSKNGISKIREEVEF